MTEREQAMFGASVQIHRELARRSRPRRSRVCCLRGLGLVLAGCLVAVPVAGGARATDPTFTHAPGSPIAVPGGADDLVAADLNRDGKLDLAFTQTHTVGIMLGNGSGGFTPTPGSPVTAGRYANRLVVADLNRDGKPDLAVSNMVSGSVTILLGDGAGGFSESLGSPISVGGQWPQGLAVADLNRDGRPDLAVPINDPGAGVAILLGDGSGGFTEPPGSPVPVPGWAIDVVAADFSRDGKPDLAVTNQGAYRVTILLGDGSGGFAEAPGSPIATSQCCPTHLAMADLNRDGNPDLAVTNPVPFSHPRFGHLEILLGDGNGRFLHSGASPLPAGGSPFPLAAADLNGDAVPDLAVGDTEASNVIILLGDGSAGFRAAAGSPVAGGLDPYSLVAADLNGDSRPDLAVANSRSSDISILLNTSAPTAVTLAAFSARPARQGVELRWRTAQETGVLGFNVYRSGVKVNRSLVGARDVPGGAGYRLLDRRGRAASMYRLQAVRLDGTTAWIGKATAQR